MELLCTRCPRRCNINRIEKKGYCGVSGEGVLLARAALHFWEEPCISGERGSGTVFFSGCSLHCVYCQNREISGGKIGKEVSIERLSGIFLELQEKGAHNINLVTPTHYAREIAEALKIARRNGLKVPTVYNTGGYETEEAIYEMAEYIDIYLTDFKYMENDLAKDLSGAYDYPEVAAKALRAMTEVSKPAAFDENGMMKSGIIVRELLLPGHVKNTEKTVEYIYRTYGDRVWQSLMNQYTPVAECPGHPELSRKVTKREYEKLIDFALSLGVKNAFIQEGKTAEESFIPAFDYEGV